MGAEAKNSMAAGVGDAMRPKRSNLNSNYFFEDNLKENKRFENILNFQENIVNSKEKFRAKRAIENNVEAEDSSNYDDDDYSSSSSESGSYES